jgi:hypothetical protein
MNDVIDEDGFDGWTDEQRERAADAVRMVGTAQSEAADALRRFAKARTSVSHEELCVAEARLLDATGLLVARLEAAPSSPGRRSLAGRALEVIEVQMQPGVPALRERATRLLLA